MVLVAVSLQGAPRIQKVKLRSRALISRDSTAPRAFSNGLKLSSGVIFHELGALGTSSSVDNTSGPGLVSPDASILQT